jgi:hypothetical protein
MLCYSVKMKTKCSNLTCYKTYSELADAITQDIRELFLHDQIRTDGQIKRNPRYYTPWSARNAKYSKADKARMLELLPNVVFLNDKNIWQFVTNDFSTIIVWIKDIALSYDHMETLDD